jgi:hypothetical protein
LAHNSDSEPWNVELLVWGLLCPCLATTRRNVKAVGDDLPLHEFPPFERIT